MIVVLKHGQGNCLPPSKKIFQITPFSDHPLLLRLTFKFTVHFPYQAQYLIPAHFLYCAGNKVLRQKLPGLTHFLQEGLYVGSYDTLVLFIGLCKDKRKLNLPFP